MQGQLGLSEVKPKRSYAAKALHCLGLNDNVNNNQLKVVFNEFHFEIVVALCLLCSVCRQV